ncbi:MAG: transposase [Myxococcales bacterium]|nr:transposase [Myxococcales bacterium]
MVAHCDDQLLRGDGRGQKLCQGRLADAQPTAIRVVCSEHRGIESQNPHLERTKAQIIVAAGLSNQAPDTEYFIPMLDRVLAGCEQIPDAALADAGFFSDANVRRAQARGVDVYIAPARTPHGEKESPPDGKASVASPMKAAMRAKLQTERGEALYRRRKTIIEPVIGQIKGRGLGRLSLRGLLSAQQEWSLIALSHNLLKLHKARRARRQSPQGPAATAAQTLFAALCTSPPPSSAPTSARPARRRCLRQRAPSRRDRRTRSGDLQPERGAQPSRTSLAAASAP